LTPGGSNTVHIYKQTVHRIQRTEHTTIKIKILEVRAVPRLCELCPGICLTTVEKARKTLRVVENCPDILVAVVQYIQNCTLRRNSQNGTYITIRVLKLTK
jgi:hypothetical protein